MTTRLDSLPSQITKLSKKKDEIPILNIQYNTNEQTDDHSHGLSSLLAVSGNRYIRNPKTRNIRRLLHPKNYSAYTRSYESIYEIGYQEPYLPQDLMK
jgi:hypothetical protein